MEQRWDIPESISVQSLTTDGRSLYAAEFSGAINRYDLNGNFLGQFADVSGIVGPDPIGQILESDISGNIYTMFGGFDSQSRTSYRLDQNGNVTAAFSHAELVFPDGIDSAASGDVYIFGAGALGQARKLFVFDSSGAYINDFEIPEARIVADIAIDEIREKLYFADPADESIHVYDISSGIPVFSSSLQAPGDVEDLFIEAESGRIFGTYLTIGTDGQGFFLQGTGFEILSNGDVVNLYIENVATREQSVLTIVAVAVPEPISLLIAVFGLLVFSGSRIRH